MKPTVFKITLMLVFGIPFCSADTVIAFGELPMQNANGVSIDGVTFGYSGPDGAEAIYGYSLGIPTENLSDPVLYGATSGTLTLSFADPTSIVSFDIVLGTAASVEDGYSVDLSDGGTGVFSQSYDIDPQLILAEGVFSYSGAPIDLLTLAFPNTTDSDDNQVASFAIDNLTFDPPATPEPGAVSLLTIGLLALGMLARVRSRKLGLKTMGG
jgi:hypothetical protein